MSLDQLDLDDWEPAPGEHDTWSMEELERHPLFMTDLSASGTENEAIDALQSALYDDETPESLCENFKDSGNELVKRGLFDDALIAYERALDTECQNARLLSQIHSNMAHVHLRKENYPECVNECYRAIGRDSHNSKAYYRAAKASLKLELFSQGIYFAKGGIDVDPDNSDMAALLGELEAGKARQDAAKGALAKAESDQCKPKLKYRWRD